ncbi:UNVERIFIED_CONTAM: MMS19 nucleotide excision repair protein [Sesamum radiatum]|uniref:MMS19 nucleotide excision repair protein n=1 Tax=Sesamum radiatum TaxID=300843 RepID=A0AAW2WMG0_SESRA
MLKLLDCLNLVKGLQILATFPGSFTSIQVINDNIFFELVAIITSDSSKTVVWKSALKALVEIGFSIEKCLDSGKAASFESTVVEKIVSLISSLDSAITLSLRLEAAFEIGATRKDFMLRVVRGLDEAIDTNFSAVFDHGNHKSNELTIKLLDTYSQKVLPWFLEIGGSEEVQLNFALSIWDKIENFRSMLYRAFAHVVSDTPLTAILGEAKKVSQIVQSILSNVCVILDFLLAFRQNEEEGKKLNWAVRETAIQCLVAVSELPHARVYPLRTKVLRAISKALDDPKRIVRQEAVRCRQAWASIASRSLHF